MWNESKPDNAQVMKAALSRELVQQAIIAYRAESFKQMQHMRYYGGGDSKLDDIIYHQWTANDIMRANGWCARQLSYYQEVYYGPYTDYLRALHHPKSPDNMLNKLIFHSVTHANQWAKDTFLTYFQAYAKLDTSTELLQTQRQALALLENFKGKIGDLDEFENYVSEHVFALNTGLDMGLDTSENTFMTIDDVLVEKYEHLIKNGLQGHLPDNMDNTPAIKAHRQHHILSFFSSPLTPDVFTKYSIPKHVRIQEHEEDEGVCEGAFVKSTSYPQMEIVHSDEEYPDDTYADEDSWSSDEDYANSMY